LLGTTVVPTNVHFSGRQNIHTSKLNVDSYILFLNLTLQQGTASEPLSDYSCYAMSTQAIVLICYYLTILFLLPCFTFPAVLYMMLLLILLF
jgi:hypothetical protein